MTASLKIAVHEVADGVAAYLQGDGSWGLANAGLVVGQNESLLIDTLFDLGHTRRMLEAFRAFSAATARAEVVVNTHANGDHCYGNVLLREHRIIASSRATNEMREMPASKLAKLMKVARMANRLGKARPVLRRLLKTIGLGLGADLLDAAPYVEAAFSRFDFGPIESVLPNEVFEDELELDLGGKRALLMALGPAHTAGDVAVFVPETKTLFAGDLLFEGMHPLIWSGTISTYQRALERLQALCPDVVVPGHGPVTDRACIERHLEYLRVLREQVRPLYDEGATPEQATLSLLRKGLGELREPERLVVNVCAAYREFGSAAHNHAVIPLFASMARLALQLRATSPT